MPGLWPMVERAGAVRLAHELDSETARALVEAGYLPLADYIAAYELSCERRLEPLPAVRNRRKMQRSQLMAPRVLRRLTKRRRA